MGSDRILPPSFGGVPETRATAASGLPTMLVIRDSHPPFAAPAEPLPEGISMIGFLELDEALSADPQPDIVLSPLVDTSFDVFEVATVLTQARYRGRLRAITAQTRGTAMIVGEIRAAFPALDFNVFRATPDGGLELA